MSFCKENVCADQEFRISGLYTIVISEHVDNQSNNVLNRRSPWKEVVCEVNCYHTYQK